MNRLKELRKEKRLTIRELGEKVNISYSTISAMENEIRPFTQANLELLCSFFNVSSDYLLGYSDVRSQQTPPTDLQFALHGYENSLSDDDKEMILSLAKKLANKNDTK